MFIGPVRLSKLRLLHAHTHDQIVKRPRPSELLDDPLAERFAQVIPPERRLVGKDPVWIVAETTEDLARLISDRQTVEVDHPVEYVLSVRSENCYSKAVAPDATPQHREALEPEVDAALALTGDHLLPDRWGSLFEPSLKAIR